MIDPVVLIDRIESLAHRCGQHEAELEKARSVTREAYNPALTEQNVIELLRCMATGRKIEAIKLYRSITGYGLKEAKDAIEDVERFHRVGNVDRF